jgi:XrtJ-associated TM-motif-TM protein
MKRIGISSLGALAILFAATVLRAQTGCTDSPENPTGVLALIGAGGWVITSCRNRIRTVFKKVGKTDC